MTLGIAAADAVAGVLAQRHRETRWIASDPVVIVRREYRHL